MDNNKKPQQKQDDKKPQTGDDIKQNRSNESAHREADRDMEDDAEFTAHSPNDDLDEGETARLGEDGNPIV